MIIKALFASLAILGVAWIPVTRAANAPIRLGVDMEHPGAAIGGEFSGLSYEAAAILPGDGPRYFRAGNDALITLFHTLGIKSLRIGGNTSDRNALH